jgi:hypothetical protein
MFYTIFTVWDWPGLLNEDAKMAILDQKLINMMAENLQSNSDNFEMETYIQKLITEKGFSLSDYKLCLFHAFEQTRHLNAA